MDTSKPDGLQFLTFKLSFNDYYAQDISNKIKSVKQRKIEKGEYQAGIPPYGYKKDNKIKNHLIPDEYSSQIVREIFDMYVNKDMSTIKIADELNRRKIEPPAIYLKIPTYVKRKSVNPDGKYVWLRAQIGKILKNEVYIGNIVGRKFQKVSHKIAKVRCTKQSEHIVLKNMHEPIIDIDMWDNAQKKLNKYTRVRTRKYDHPLKGLVYCKECGSIATIRAREGTKKDGTVWRRMYFICSKRNNYTNLCNCKQISADVIEEALCNKIKEEIGKINFTKTELKKIYNNAKKEANSKINILEVKLKKLNSTLQKIENTIEEIYEDKINKVIKIDDFRRVYEKKQNEKNKILAEKEKVEEELKLNKSKDIDYIKISKNFLNSAINQDKILKKIVNKIEFDSDKTVKMSLNITI